MTRQLPEVLLSGLAGLAYGIAWALAVRASSRRASVRSFVVVSAVGLVPHSAAIALRWAAVGHPPVFGSYENSLASAWFLVVGTLVLARSRSWRYAAVGTLPSALVVLAWGLRFNRHRIPLTISERSLWIDLHVAVAWTAYVALTAALLVAMLVLARALERRRGRSFHALAGMPDAAWADELVVQSVACAFLGFSAVVASGAWYSFLLFGEAWRWDTVEVLALVVWLQLGLTLHLRLFSRWRGPRLAAMTAAGYIGVIAIYWLLALFPVSSYHFFELPF